MRLLEAHLWIPISRNIFTPGSRVHLCGIGGVSMSPLAEVLHSMGLKVQGSDMQDSAAVEHLRALGIPVTVGHQAESVEGADFLIRTAAVHDDNPEILRARETGIPVFERAEAWGAIMRGYRNALCIAGTHGKTTTTSMATHIFMAAGADPTVMIGGTLPMLHSGYRVGGGDTIILESCEYCNSFLHFFPTVAVVLNVEADHLDFFKDLQDVEHSFRQFAQLVPPDGHIVANADDPGAMEALQGLPLFTFGVQNAADCRSERLQWENGLPAFDVVVRGQVYCHVELQIGGVHNVMNALAAASAAYVLGIPGRAVQEGLASLPAPAAALSTRAPTTGPGSTMTTPTTPGNSTPCCRWQRGLDSGGSSAPSSPTPTAGPRPSFPTLSGN